MQFSNTNQHQNQNGNGNYQVSLEKILAFSRQRIQKLRKQTERFPEVANVIGTQLGELERDFEFIKNRVLDKNDSQYDFVVSVGQNIRQSASLLSGLQQMLEDSGLGDEQQSYVDILNVSTSALRSVVDDLTNFVEFQSAELKLRNYPFDLVEIVEGLANHIYLKLTDHQTCFHVRFDPNLPMQWVGDSDRVRQVLSTLLDLALAQVWEGEVRLSVGWDSQPSQFKFLIEFTGELPEFLKHSIEASRELARLEENDAGVAMGAYLCRGIVNLMKGRLEFLSDENDGRSRILIEIPSTIHDPRSLKSVGLETTFRKIAIYQSDPMVPHCVENSARSLALEVQNLRSLVELNEYLVTGKLDKNTCIFFGAIDIEEVENIHQVLNQIDAENRPMVSWAVMREHASTYKDYLSGGFSSQLVCPVLPNRLSGFLNDNYHRKEEITEKADSANLTGSEPLDAEFCRVLVVDDSSFNASIMKKLLLRLNCYVKTVSSGFEALEVLITEYFDIVLMDCLMPGMNGYETTREIRYIPAFESIPIIAVSADTKPENRKRCAEAGMTDFLVKPVEFSVLEATIERWRGVSVDVNERQDPSEVFTKLGYGNQAFKNALSSYLTYIDGWINSIKEAVANHDSASLQTYLYFIRSFFSLIRKENTYAQLRQIELNAFKNRWCEVQNDHNQLIRLIGESVKRTIKWENILIGMLEESVGDEHSSKSHSVSEIETISQRITVLVVDRDPITRELLKSQEQWNVLVAADLGEVEGIIEEVGISRIDCAICSENTGTDDLFEFVNVVTERDETISILFYTHIPSKKLINEALEHGIHGVLSKPASVRDLQLNIETATLQTKKKRHSRETERAARRMGHSQLNLLTSNIVNGGDLVTDFYYAPRQEAGGDFFVNFEIDENRQVLFLTDVSGHDLEAAFVSAFFHGMIRGSLKLGKQALETALIAFNEFLVGEWNPKVDRSAYVDKSIATCAVEIDRIRRCVSVYLAGSCIPIVVDFTGDARLVSEKTGMPLGWFEETTLEHTEISLKYVQDFYVWSDGVEQLAEVMQVSPMSLAFHLLKNRKTGNVGEYVEKANDDLLVICGANSRKFEKKRHFCLFFEVYTGDELADIDQLQETWSKSLLLCCPEIGDELLYDVLLCMRESVINKLKHGCKGQENKNTTLSVLFNRKTSDLKVVVEDNGDCFLPSPILNNTNPERFHRGINLMHAIAKSSSYSDDGRTHTMTFDFSHFSLTKPGNPNEPQV